MTIDISKIPYLDRFKKEQNRTKVLFNPDRPLQQAELNEMQSIQEYYLASMGNSIFADGDLQSGMDFVLQENKLTVKDGQVYLAGKVRTFNQQDINITKVGREVIGVKLTQKVITSDDDDTLLDQTSGVPSAFSKGADRLEETVTLVKDDPEGASVYIFEDGELFTSTENPEMTKINNILAERTYDESGSYRVYGFDLWAGEKLADTSKIQVVVDAGRAYVLGFKVDKPVSTRLSIDKATETREVQNEGFFYQDAVRSGTLGNNPVSSVNKVVGQIQVVKEQVSRGIQGGGTDFLQNGSVFQVDKVWSEGANPKEYTQGVDFQLSAGQSISWAPEGAEPPAGSTYFVTYRYNKTLTEGTDYQVVIDGEGDNRTCIVDFNGMSGVKPIDNTLVNVDYTFYLARKDLIVLDKNGSIIVHKGQPDTMRTVEAPNHIDPFTLQLGTVTVLPDSDTIETNLFTITRLSMEDLQKLKIRVDNIEYNEAVNMLDNPAMAGENPIYLRGVFSDGFISLDKYDSSHPDAKIAFSFEDAEITLPYKEINKVVPEILENASEAHVWGRLVSAPFTEELTITQPYATEAMNVNPYNMFNKQGIMKLNPSADNWIEEERVTITKEEVASFTAHRWWLHGGQFNSAQDKWYADNFQPDSGSLAGHNNWQGESMSGTTLSSGGTQTLDSMIEFMRQIDIEFEAENLHPNANNLYLNFDGVRVPITPATGFLKGSEPGTIQANSDGVAKGTFTIPQGIRCGTREVSLRNKENIASNGFTAQGRKKTVQDIIIRTRVTVVLIDPLAQSFQFDENKVISSFGLYFASKDTKENVIVQVRGMSDGGQPNKTIYAETVLPPSKINASADGTKETIVAFDDPIMCTAGQEYCVVIITDSDQYTMWIATRGMPRIDNPNAIVNGNPYLTGVLYSSSNASAWTAHQDSDLKFNIYTAKFNEEAVIEFDTMKNVSVDRIVLMSTYLTPQNTGCKWDMKLVLENEASNITVAQKEWEPIANYIDMDVMQLAREVKLRATFKSNKYISPLLSLDDIMFVGFLTSLEGSYVARTIDLEQAPYNTLKVSYEAFLPANTTVTPRYSTDEGKTWKLFTVTPTVTKQNQNFDKYEYVEKLTTGTATHKTVKLRLDLKSANSFLRPRARRLMSLMKNE